MESANNSSNIDTQSIDTFDLDLDLKDDWENEVEKWETLAKRVKNLHVKCLYCQIPMITRPAKEAWTTIVKNVSGAQGQWREMGIFLGVKRDDLDYIEHSTSADKTDTILRVYMQDDCATVDKIICALTKMRRFDIIRTIQEPLTQISNHFKESTHSSDAGYVSNSDSRIIAPKNIPNILPQLLKVDNSEDDNRELLPKQRMLTKPIISLDENRPVIFLTFSEDGKYIADTIPIWIKNWSDESVQVQIVTLEDRKHEVLQNPEIVIQELISKADYVVPIVTEDYLKRISSEFESPSVLENLDAQYVRFIYTHLLHMYASVNSCFNINVRCILPQSANRDLVKKLRHYQILIPWTCEADFDKTFKDLLENVK